MYNAVHNCAHERTRLCVVTADENARAASRTSLSDRRGAKRDYTRRGKRRRRKEWVIFHRDDFRCVYCGKSSVEDGVKLEADHILAHSQGGKDTAGNLVTACRGCNRSKFDEELDPDARARLEGIVATRNRARRISDQMPVDLGRQATTKSQRATDDSVSSSSDEGSSEPAEAES